MAINFVVVIKQILLPDRESWALQGASSSSESTENAVELRFWHKPIIIIIIIIITTIFICREKRADAKVSELIWLLTKS